MTRFQFISTPSVSRLLLLTSCFAFLCGCPISSEQRMCFAGEEIACECSDGRSGIQFCQQEGDSFSRCLCTEHNADASTQFDTGANDVDEKLDSQTADGNQTDAGQADAIVQDAFVQDAFVQDAFVQVIPNVDASTQDAERSDHVQTLRDADTSDTGEVIIPSPCNGTIATLVEGSALTGSISAASDVDCFRIELPALHIGQVRMTPTVDLDLVIYDSNTVVVAASSNSSTVTETAYLEKAEGPGLFFAAIGGYQNSTGDYSIELDTEQDVGDSFETAELVSFTTLTSSIQTPHDVDVFKFQVEPGILQVTLSPSVDLDISLHGPNQLLLASSSNSATSTESIAQVIAEAGHYFISVKGFEGAIGDYEFSIEQVPD